MTTWFHDNERLSWQLPAQFSQEDVRLSEDVLCRYIERFSQEGDVVLDPFVGFGTTLVVANRLGRLGIGVEIDPERADYARSLNVGEVYEADIRDFDWLTLPRCQLCISSPPYMNSSDAEDPLSGYQAIVQSYDHYIEQLANIYVQCGQQLLASGTLVIQLQNLKKDASVTPLVSDLMNAIGNRLTLVRDEVLLWQQPSYGYDHGACLVYARRVNRL